MNRLLAPFFARSLLRNSTETLATQATTIGNECILDRPIYTELKFSESCRHFSFFWRQLFISNACVREGVLNTGSDVLICCVSLPRASFCRKMSSLQLIFSPFASRLDDKDSGSEGSRKRDKRPEMWETNSIPCVYVAGGFFVSFSVLVRSRARANEETMGEGARGREKDCYTQWACVAGAKRGGRRGEGESAKAGKWEGWGKGPLPSLPNPPPFFPFLLSPTPFDACYLG